MLDRHIIKTYNFTSKNKGIGYMEVRILRYFLAVAREESISKAAQYLHITQPTLSRQLMELEEDLGVRLLNRGRRNHKITLTK